ncbi:hypothetical protein rosag_11980 [Roseisolibacter agri]|uniref:Uncharacterized protein n=2 Tax=Roseisolibacter agri TaxID=2014610 RepID=A0AA37V0K6_9BACT|nr:hypothetical protein rosag_11980 [Roseisolibacter agri]
MMMVLAPHASHAPAQAPRATVYTVLADAARTRSTRWLATEGAVTVAVVAGVLLLAPRWWPLAALLASVAAYAAWGLLDRAPAGHARAWRAVQRLLVVAATASVVAALAGTAVRLFWGDAPGPYGACYRDDGRAIPCRARDGLPPARGPVI